MSDAKTRRIKGRLRDAEKSSSRLSAKRALDDAVDRHLHGGLEEDDEFEDRLMIAMTSPPRPKTME